MTHLSLQSKVIASPNVLFEDLEGESILLEFQQEEYFRLDDVGTRMWQALLEQDSVQGAIDVLSARYDVEPERLRQDLEALIAELLENGLVEVVNP